MCRSLTQFLSDRHILKNGNGYFLERITFEPGVLSVTGIHFASRKLEASYL